MTNVIGIGLVDTVRMDTGFGDIDGVLMDTGIGDAVFVLIDTGIREVDAGAMEAAVGSSLSGGLVIASVSRSPDVLRFILTQTHCNIYGGCSKRLVVIVSNSLLVLKRV